MNRITNTLSYKGGSKDNTTSLRLSFSLPCLIVWLQSILKGPHAHSIRNSTQQVDIFSLELGKESLSLHHTKCNLVGREEPRSIFSKQTSYLSYVPSLIRIGFKRILTETILIFFKIQKHSE